MRNRFILIVLTFALITIAAFSTNTTPAHAAGNPTIAVLVHDDYGNIKVVVYSPVGYASYPIDGHLQLYMDGKAFWAYQGKVPYCERGDVHCYAMVYSAQVPTGVHTFKVVYSGSAKFAPSVSTVYTFYVN